jgi:hypothetical protein
MARGHPCRSKAARSTADHDQVYVRIVDWDFPRSGGKGEVVYCRLVRKTKVIH